MTGKPLRILILVHRLADDSPYCVFVHEQARALRGLGHEVAVIAPVGVVPGQRLLRPAASLSTRSTPKRAEVDGVPIRYPRYLTLGDPGTRLLGGRLMARAALPVARELHQTKPFDILHAHMLPIEGHAGLLLGRALGIPVALTVHGTDVQRFFRPGRKPWPRNRAIANGVSVLMAVSSALAGRVAPYRRAPVNVLHNGVDLSLIPAGGRNRRRAVITGGALKPSKRLHDTLDAFAALAGAYPDATLTILGEGPERASLEGQIAGYKLQDRVTLTGAVPLSQALAHMAESDLFVMPSSPEGFGIVYVEAMAAGCVAVGSAGEGIADVIRHGENGYLVPPGDAAALTDTLRALLEGGEQVEAVRRRGVATARALTWRRNAEACTALYERAIDDANQA
ncbi:MAG: glycosyltransferase [Clostridia bacterium]|nr:glycosyltransferase [Clostridia bacterium]